ncbi:MAG: UbiA family prenyltransferase [Proteobacteria bacterium]|nr:UbiA family prenyltransferase [Pseudomonadota bacterium]
MCRSHAATSPSLKAESFIDPANRLPAADDVPLCVDLDGTLAATDVLAEGLVVLVTRAPWLAPLVPWWLGHGRARLKREVERRFPVCAERLPYRAEVVDLVRRAAADGRSVYLATGADAAAASAVTAHLGGFAGVFASDGVTNLTGTRKADALRSRFGVRGFDYAGNDAIDAAVWRVARRAYVMGSDRIAKHAAAVAPIAMHWRPPDAGVAGRLAAAWAALRPHQWIKNLLVFVPMLAAHRIGDLSLWRQAIAAWAAFSMAASAAYVLNDLADLGSDRRHPRKRRRPFASGRLPVAAGAALVPLVLAAAALLAWALPHAFGAWLFIYLVLTTAYSMGVKRLGGVDVVVLAALYALRVVAGAAATGIVLSGWLIAFSACMFLSLALVKREVELHSVRRAGGERTPGRAYRLSHLRHVRIAGWFAALGAVGVLGVYVLRPDVTALYRHPGWLWAGCALIAAWLAHIWRRAAHGHMHDDPLVFALSDRWSYATLVVLVLTVIAAT